MKDFLLRTVSDSITLKDQEGNEIRVTATRTRNSNGHAGITLDVGTNRVLDLSSDLEDYQGAAVAIAELLTHIAAEPCALPSVKAEPGSGGGDGC